jgi:hypothetical protein
MPICKPELDRRRRTNQKRRLILEDQATGPSLPDITTTGPTLSEEFTSNSVNTGLIVSQDGTTLYYPRDGYGIYSRTMSTPYDVSTCGTQGSVIQPNTQTGGPTGSSRFRSLNFNPDGTTVFITDFQNQRLYEYHLTTPYDVSEIHNSDYDKMFWLGLSTVSVFFSYDGAYAYFLNGTGLIRRYTLTTPWTFVGTASGANYDYDAEALGDPAHGTCYGALMSADGTRVIAIASALRRFYQYTLATPYDTRTATSDGYVAMSGGGTNAMGLHQIVEADGVTTRDEFYVNHYGSTYQIQRYTY